MMPPDSTVVAEAMPLEKTTWTPWALTVVEVATGVVVLLLMVVWASAGAAHSRAETLAIAGPARSARAKRRRRGGALKPAWASLRAASGEKYPVINFDPSRRIDRSSMIVSSE